LLRQISTLVRPLRNMELKHSSRNSSRNSSHNNSHVTLLVSNRVHWGVHLSPHLTLISYFSSSMLTQCLWIITLAVTALLLRMGLRCSKVANSNRYRCSFSCNSRTSIQSVIRRFRS
jgi:hypothetical protein